MLSDEKLQRAIDVPLTDGIPLLISDQKYLCRELIRLRAVLRGISIVIPESASEDWMVQEASDALGVDNVE